MLQMEYCLLVAVLWLLEIILKKRTLSIRLPARDEFVNGAIALPAIKGQGRAISSDSAMDFLNRAGAAGFYRGFLDGVPGCVEEVHPAPSRLESGSFGIEVGFFYGIHFCTSRSGLSTKDVAEGFTSSTAPGRHGRSLGLFSNAESVVEADGEVAQGDHVAGGLGVRDAAGVFAHAHIAHAVGSVLNRVPVADDGLAEFFIADFVLGLTALMGGDFNFGELAGICFL